MQRTRTAEINENLNHAYMADKSGRPALAQKYRDRAEALIELDVMEMEAREAFAQDGIDVEVDLSELLEPANDYDADSLIDKITTSD